MGSARVTTRREYELWRALAQEFGNPLQPPSPDVILTAVADQGWAPTWQPAEADRVQIVRSAQPSGDRLLLGADRHITDLERELDCIRNVERWIDRRRAELPPHVLRSAEFTTTWAKDVPEWSLGYVQGIVHGRVTVQLAPGYV